MGTGKRAPAEGMAFSLSRTPEHYTPHWLLQCARDVMGDIDLDPCTSLAAQRRVRARGFYTREDDGLSKGWALRVSDLLEPSRVFINPPGDRSGKLVQRFFAKLKVEIDAGAVIEAIWLAFNLSQLRTLQSTRPLLECMDLCVLNRRIRFTGEHPTKDNAVLYYGPNRAAFFDVFGRHGAIWPARLVAVSDLL